MLDKVTAVTYDAGGNQLTVRDPNNVGADMVYDNLGRNTQQTDTFGDVTKTEGALNELKLDGSTVSTRTSEVLGNGITETRAYRADNLLSTIGYSNTSIGDLAYAWDANKNKTAETIGGAMSGYGFTASGTTYDFEDRLTGYQRAATSGSALLSQSWSLTTVGDWSSVTTNGTVQTRTHGPTHELLTAGGQSVTTDVKGNTTLLPSTLIPTLNPQLSSLNLAYDFDNKMKTVDVDANSSVDVEYKYDALGRRVARVGSSGSLVYVQADQQTIADYGVGDAPASPLYRYVYASYIDEPVVRKEVGTSGTLHYYHRNQQYSIYALTTAAGAIAERYAYTAYGQPTILSAAAAVLTSSAINNRYTYTAREWDNTIGLHHFRARWMSGLTGRFLTRDPIGHRSGEGALYAFFGNSAMSFGDPSGTIKISLVPGSDTTRTATCGGVAQASYIYTLDGGTPNCVDDKGDPVDGYLVQKITVFCVKKSCKDCDCSGREIEKSKSSYFEAWHWPKNAAAPTLGQNAGYTDRASWSIPDNTCGYYSQIADARFFCNNLKQRNGKASREKIGSDIDTWKAKGTMHKQCGQTNSGILPTRDTAPWFWNEPGMESDEGQASRWMGGTWSCCPGKPKTAVFDQYFSPSP